MKYIVVLGDGMADYPLEVLGGKTPLEEAETPNLDGLAPLSEVGLCKTVPDKMKPGSDVANMSVLGFDPREFYTGRSPLEAVSMGIELKDTDVTLRCNLVTLSDGEPFESKVMRDYSAGEITTAEAAELIAYLKKSFDDDKFSFYAGISYRHCLVVKDGIAVEGLTPPHDISDRVIGEYLPHGNTPEKQALAQIYLNFMKRSYGLLKEHPINKKRIAEGKNPANCIWLWGEGTKPALEDFEKLHSLKGGIISAVDLVRGIGLLANMKIIPAEGSTGDYHTNFEGKANAACDALLGGLDYVYIHMEAPDECGHHGDVKNKIYSIEQIDKKVVGTILKRLKDEQFTMLVCPDHPTPCTLKTHVSDPIPYLIYQNGKNRGNGAKRYTEREAAGTRCYLPEGKMLIERLLKSV